MCNIRATQRCHIVCVETSCFCAYRRRAGGSSRKLCCILCFEDLGVAAASEKDIIIQFLERRFQNKFLNSSDETSNYGSDQDSDVDATDGVSKRLQTEKMSEQDYWDIIVKELKGG